MKQSRPPACRPAAAPEIPIEVRRGDSDLSWEPPTITKGDHMALRSEYSLGHSQFNNFLFAYVGEEKERSEEHTSELQSLMRISYAVFCLTKKQKYKLTHTNQIRR